MITKCEGEGIEAQKLGKIEGSIGSLGDSKYTARNANIVLGLFSPFKFELPQYKGYNIQLFKDHIRFLKVYVNRDGEMGGVCPLFFDGAVCNFKELPRPNDPKLNEIYEYLNNLNNNNTVKTFCIVTKKNNAKKHTLKSLLFKLLKL